MGENRFSLLTIQSSKRQQLYTYAVSLFIMVAFLLTVRMAHIQLPEVKPFLPAYTAIVLFTDWMTAYLLWNQYRFTRSQAHLCLSMVYFYSGLVVIPHIFTFPGVFSEVGLFGAGSQTAVYFWCFWHGGFPIGLLLFYCISYRESKAPQKKLPTSRSSLLMLCIVSATVGFLFLLTTKLHNMLPVIIQDGNYSGIFTAGMGPIIILLNMLVVFLFVRKKNKLVLDLLLLLASVSFLIDVLLTLGAEARYTLGWYAARLISLFSSSVVLGAFVLELNQLYVHLGRTHQQLQCELETAAAQRRELARREARYRLVVDHIHEAVFLMDKDQKLLYVSPYWSTLTGYQASVSLQKNLLEFIHPDEQEWVKLQLRSLLHKEQEWVKCAVRLVHHEQYVVWTELVVTGIYDEGELQELHGTIRDVTEQRGRFELERNRVLGELAVAICHEVRNPLTATKGFLQLLQEETAHKNVYVNVSMEELQKAEQVLGDYLQFAKPTIQQTEQIAIGQLLLSCLNVVEAYALSHQVHIEYALKPRLYVQADGNLLSQAFMNVMKNGIEAMPNGGTLQVQAESRAGQIVVEMKDTGIGMTGEQILRLGEPFYTLKEKGTGLGMMMTYQFIYAMKGEIVVDSKVGEGTKVTIFLPPAP